MVLTFRRQNSTGDSETSLAIVSIGEEVKPNILALVVAFLTLTAGFSYPTKTSANWNGDVLLIAAADEDDEDEDDDDDGGASSYQTRSYSPVYSHYSSVTTRRPFTTRQTRKIHHRKPITHKHSTKRNTHSVTKHRHASTSHSTKKGNVAKKRVPHHSKSVSTGKESRQQKHGLKKQHFSRKRPSVKHQSNRTRLSATPRKIHQPSASHLARSNQATNPTHRLRSDHKPDHKRKALYQPIPDRSSVKNKPSRARKSARTTDASIKKNKTRIQIKRSRGTGMRSKTSGKNERYSTSPNARRNPSARISKQPSRGEPAHSVSSKANSRTPKKAVNQGKAQRKATQSVVNRPEKTPKPSPVAGSKTGQSSHSRKDVKMPVKPSRLDTSPKFGDKAKRPKSATKKSRNQ